MKFTVSSTDLLQGLFAVSRVIAAKSTLSILDNFLFVMEGNNLIVTASDQETTFRTVITIDNVSEGGNIAVPAKILTDTLKGLPTQPIEFNTDQEKHTINILWQNGMAHIPFLPSDEFPTLKELENPRSVTMNGEALAEALGNTMYATSDDYLRPATNGIFFDIAEDLSSTLPSNSHILVTFDADGVTGEKSSFSLPKKSANILKGALAKLEDEKVTISYDDKYVHFQFDSTLVACRLIQGNFPNYRAVMPQNNENIISVSREDLLNATRRVKVCANPATSQMTLRVSLNQIETFAQDVDFSSSAQETVSCEYSGSPIELSVKANFFEDILNNLPYEQVFIKLKDSTKPVLLLPADSEEAPYRISVLLMPMIANY